MKLVLIGAGQRGMLYAQLLQQEEQAEIAAVAEPDDARRKRAAALLRIPESRCFQHAEELWALEQVADAAIIASMDRDHYPQAMAALDAGYHLLLEKPISPNPRECMEIAEKSAHTGRGVVVCHVLRHSPFFSQVKEIIDGVELGRVLSVRLDENVGNFHMAHSFVRGNWRRSDQSSPIIMQKSCHDMDLLNYLVGGRAKSLSSFGKLQYFKEENAPEGSADRCCRCAVEPGCRFSAYKSYLPVLGDWPATAVCSEQTEGAMRQALKTSPYGRCVYRCDNTVCESQVVSLEYEHGPAVSFTMSGFTNRVHRTIKVMCEDGEIEGDDERRQIVVTRFFSNQVEGYTETVIHTPEDPSSHGGADLRFVKDFALLLKTGAINESRSSIEVSVDSHIMACAAETSRLEGRMIHLEQYRQEIAAKG